MSDRSDLERDLVEEDEVRALLRPGDRDLVAPPFATVEHRVTEPRGTPGLVAAAATALVLIVTVVVVGSTRGGPAAPSISTASPEIAIPQIASPGARAPALCPEPQHPGYLPWPSTRSQTETTTTSTAVTFFGPGSGSLQAQVRISAAPYVDGTPGREKTVDGRTVHVYFTPELRSGAQRVVPGQPVASPSLTIQQPAEARAWWREASGVCPVITVALVWPDSDPATHEPELLKVVASIPVGP